MIACLPYLHQMPPDLITMFGLYEVKGGQERLAYGNVEFDIYCYYSGCNPYTLGPLYCTSLKLPHLCFSLLW